MKFPPSLLLLFVILLLVSGCESHRHKEEQNAALLLNQLNVTAELEIVHEQHGDPPPHHFSSWQAFWHNRFFALRQSSQEARRGRIGTRQIANADIAFIKRRRAELGLPPAE